MILRNLGLFVFALLLAGCDEEEKCKCKVDNGQLPDGDGCGFPNYERSISWDRDGNKPCEQHSEASGCCPNSVRTSYRWNDEPFFSLAASSELSVGHPMALRQMLTPADISRLPETVSCQAECSKVASPFCASVSGAQGEAIRDAIDLVTGRMDSGLADVEKASLMSLFDVESDLCERGNLELNGSELSNSGLACVLDTDLSAGEFVLQSVSVTMPETITAILESGETGDPRFAFPYASEAPVLEIGGFLQEDFGGRIERINFGNEISIRTTNGCIGL